METEIFAHRGGSAVNLGNTMTAFRYAFAMGCGVEADVRRCRDALVVTHCQQAGGDAVSSYALEDLRQFAVRPHGTLEWCPADVHGLAVERVPTLHELLRLWQRYRYPRAGRLLLDIKEAGLVDEVAQVVVEAGILSSGVLYGTSRLEEVTGKARPGCSWLWFVPAEHFDCLQAEEVAAIFGDVPVGCAVRIWQDQLPLAYDDVNAYVQAVQKQWPLIVTAGSANEAAGGRITRQALDELRAVNVAGMILNDPALAFG